MEDDQRPVYKYSSEQNGVLAGHTGWVTKVFPNPIKPDHLISSSRDKTVLVWKLLNDNAEICGKPTMSFVGHDHFVSDCAISRDGGFILTSSWDKTLRLWDINRGVTKRYFKGHTGDVLSVAFSSDNRQIVSGSRDRTVCLWNTLAVPKHVFKENGHKDYVSCVTTNPVSGHLSIISAGWDKVVKIWSLKPTGCAFTLHGHQNAVNTVALSPDGSTLVSGGKDGNILLWKFATKEFSIMYNTGANVSSIVFHPFTFLIAAACGQTINLYDIQSNQLVHSITPRDAQDLRNKPDVTCLSWSADGSYIYAGYTDNKIRIYKLNTSIQRS